MIFFLGHRFSDPEPSLASPLGQISWHSSTTIAHEIIALALGLIAVAAIARHRAQATTPTTPANWGQLAAVCLTCSGFQLLHSMATPWAVRFQGALAALALILTLIWLRSLFPHSLTALAAVAPAAFVPSEQPSEQPSVLPAPEPPDQKAPLAAAQTSNEQLLQREQAVTAELAATLETLEATAERLNIALSAAQMGTWDWDLMTQKQYWSPKAQEILGLSQSENSGHDPWLQRVHPADLPRIEGAIADAKTHQQNFSEECRLWWPDHTVHWVLVQGRVLASPAGPPHRIIGVIQEITAAKQAEMALRLNEARFRAVFEQAAVGMARLSPAGRWLQVNQTLCQLLGYSAEELVGRTFQDITDPADHEQDAHYYQQLLAQQISACRFEKRYLHRDGSPIWTMVTASTERDEAGDLVAFIAVIEDIRGLKQARSELQQRASELEQVNGMLAMTTALLENRNAELDQFAYVASHDLKAPLRAIANLSEWIEEDLGDRLPAANQHQLNLLRRRVHRMEALINGLLEYSRVGRQERQWEIVDVALLLSDILDSLSPPPTFTVSLTSAMPTLETNRIPLSQVFANLISNAIKHHHRDAGHIQIAAQDQGDRVEFAVTDDGPGIAPQYHDKIFTIFQTLKSRDEFESTGIGLAVVKKIIEAAGGTIVVDSTPGAGATFRFTWPQSPAPGANQP